MTAEIATNKLRNEEFKIWKKTVPLLYQHIFCVKPKYLVPEKGLQKDKPRCLIFSGKVIPNKIRGVLSVFAYYSLDNEIYEIEGEVPLGLHVSKDYVKEKLPVPQYDGIIEKFQITDQTPKWTVSKDRRIHKLKTAGEGSVIAMLDSGAIVWFHDGTESPVCIVESGLNKIPGNQEAKEFINYLAAVDLDFDVSSAGDQIIAGQFAPDGSKVNVRCISNNEKDLGKVIRSFDIPDVKSIHCIKFYTQDIFAFTDNLGRLFFYDLRNPDTALWSIPDEKILAFDFSPFLDTFMVTVSVAGELKFWDIRTVSSKNKETEGDKDKLEPIFVLNNYVEEPVSTVEFATVSPSELITVGYSGSVYHWDINTYFQRVNELADEEDGQEESYTIDMDEIQTESLVFYHTGGSRRHLGNSVKKNSVASHPLIEGLIGTIDTDGLITLYKPFTGAIPDPDESKDK